MLVPPSRPLVTSRGLAGLVLGLAWLPACGSTAAPLSPEPLTNRAAAAAPAMTLATEALEGPYSTIAAFCTHLGESGDPDAAHRDADPTAGCDAVDPQLVSPPELAVGAMRAATVVLVTDSEPARTCRVALQTSAGWFVEATSAAAPLCADPSYRETTSVEVSDVGEARPVIALTVTSQAHVRDDDGWIDGEESTLWLCDAGAAASVAAPRCTRPITIACDPIACYDHPPDAWRLDWSVDGDTVRFSTDLAPDRLPADARARLGAYRLAP